MARCGPSSRSATRFNGRSPASDTGPRPVSDAWRCSAATTRRSRTRSPGSSPRRCSTRCSTGRGLWRGRTLPHSSCRRWVRRRDTGVAMFPLNVPNVLTLLRILAVPVIVVGLVGETPNGDALAAGVFALAALTDGLDGYIARRRDDVTTFGKLVDPLADKLLIVAALVSLVSLGRLAAWVAMVIIARELAVTGLRAV